MTNLYIPKRNRTSVYLTDEEWMIVSLVADEDASLNERRNSRNISATIGKMIREYQKQNGIILPQNGNNN